MVSTVLCICRPERSAITYLGISAALSNYYYVLLSSSCLDSYEVENLRNCLSADNYCSETLHTLQYFLKPLGNYLSAGNYCLEK